MAEVTVLKSTFFNVYTGADTGFCSGGERQIHGRPRLLGFDNRKVSFYRSGGDKNIRPPKMAGGGTCP